MVAQPVEAELSIGRRLWIYQRERFPILRTALLLAVLLVVVGVQFVSLGLIGEMVARTYHESQRKPIFVIKEEF